MSITDPVTILSIILCVFVAILYYGRKRNIYHNFPPGPTPLPIIGNIHIMDMKRPYETLHQLSKKYGPVYSIQIGEEKMVVLAGYETVKDALVNHADEFSARAKVPLFHETMMGHGVIFSYDENWRVMRRFTLSTLRDFGMGKETIENKINDESDFLVKEINTYKGKPFDNTMIINAAVSNIIVSILLSHRFDYEDPTLLRLLKMVNENVRLVGSPMAMLYNAFPSVMSWFPGIQKTLANNRDDIFQFVRETFTAQKKELDANDQRNLIDRFLVKQQEEKPSPELYFTNDNLLALVMDLFGAGMETTSTTLRWGLLLMMKYPEIQRKVQNEIEKVIGSSEPQAAHRKDMPYTDAVIHEIQRFGNIVPNNLPHATTQDVTFRGYFIPKGTQVIPLLTSVLFDKNYFEKAEVFYPEHFLDAGGNFVKNEAFMPFSAGKRSCAGENLAKMELFMFFVKLLQNFTFQAPPGATLDLTRAVGLTSPPVSHMICAVPHTPQSHTDSLHVAGLSRVITVQCTQACPRVYTGINFTDMIAMDPVTVLLSVVVIIFLAYVFSNQNNKYKNMPPGPKHLPIIGNMLTINMSKPHKSFIELSKTYGPVFSVQLGMTKMVILCGYEAIKDALINHADEFSNRPRAPVLAKLGKNNGLIFSNGENWKVMRRFTLSTLRDFGMGKKGIENKITEEAECLTKIFKSYGGKPFNNLTIVNAAVANIIVSILLSHRFEYDDPTLLQLMSLVNENVRLLGSPMIRLYNVFPTVMDWLPGVHTIIFENIKKVQTFIRATFTKQKEELDVNDQRNLIDAFLAKQMEGKPESTEYYHNDNLTVLVGNLFAAGMETTSTTLRWGLLLMMKYPEIQKKVQNEIERVIGSAQPQIEHRKQLPYTDAVVHEIQRFGDIVPGNVPHATSQDVTFRGYFIPKGTIVMPVLSSILKSNAYFEKPEEFYPEHFLTSEGHFKKNEAFIPFSMGKRSCAGENLANMELFLFFTSLLQNFTFQAPPGAKLDLTSAMGVTNAPHPYEMCAIPRS
ncbi:uncharacterized protein LOC134910838 [Pseudophryne corroboree]|uniref:uncharacterized protein LOC134910838 n=1 Tax=Pseudophryne corroboree TaxID=495146 RepID=UPI003081CFE6